MLYKINKNGYVINEGNSRKILKEINQLYINKLESNLLRSIFAVEEKFITNYFQTFLPMMAT
jgi:hypothetical protein